MFDIESLVRTFGYLGLFAVIFAETGLLFGFFLPGDSLLFTTGFLASQGLLDITTVCAVLFAAAVLGDSVGYTIGYKLGKRLFKKEDSLFFHKDHVVRAKIFYEKHGGKTIIIARFMPLIRTFAPVVAGMGDMPYIKFLSYNIIGAALWAIGLTLGGFYLGKAIPNVDTYLLPIVGLIVVISLAPGMYHTLKTKEQRTQIRMALASLFKLFS